MIKHIVTFKLTGTPAERKEVANKFKDALMALPLTIDVLKSIEGPCTRCRTPRRT